MKLAELTGSGLGSNPATAIIGLSALYQTATGTTQADAAVVQVANNYFTTVASGTGGRLPVGTISDKLLVINLGANTLKVYPPTGGRINGGTVNASVDLAASFIYELLNTDPVSGLDYRIVNSVATPPVVPAVDAEQIDFLAGYFVSLSNQAYKLVVKYPYEFTITETVTDCESGTCTATFSIDGVNLGGTPNAVSTSEETQAHVSANVVAVGQDLTVTISANSTCLGMSFNIVGTREFTTS